MKIFNLAIVFLMVGLLSCQGQDDVIDAKKLGKPKTDAEKISYSIGLDIGSNMRKDSLEASIDYFVLGFITGIKGDSTLMSEQEVLKALDLLQKKVQAKQQEQMQIDMEKNKKLGEQYLKENPKFLAEFKAKEGVSSTASGLLYEIMKKGDGQKPAGDDLVKVDFKAMLIDGTVFDNTYSKESMTVPVEGGLPGVAEILQQMPVGSKWKVVIPPELAFGPDGMPPKVPPHAIVVFEIELHAIAGKVGDDPGGMGGQNPQRR